ncbi:hypothetical protein J6590_064350 [Homalodisca vitripennis]|nr:hypothetical protein J6590_064350 [Homalodisca vitripennis]
MPAIWAELVLAHFQRLQTRNAALDFGSVSSAQSAFHYYNSLVYTSVTKVKHTNQRKNVRSLKSHGEIYTIIDSVSNHVIQAGQA